MLKNDICQGLGSLYNNKNQTFICGRRIDLGLYFESVVIFSGKDLEVYKILRIKM